MPSLLFVCTGNLCRSPMAMVLFRARLRRSDIISSTWRVESAGTWAQDGAPATLYASETMAARGLDLSGHRARTVSRDLLSQFNLILVMETNHKEALYTEFPDLANRIFLLSEMSGKIESIEDPYGGEPMDYIKCAATLEYWIETGWMNILRLSTP